MKGREIQEEHTLSVSSFTAKSCLVVSLTLLWKRSPAMHFWTSALLVGSCWTSMLLMLSEVAAEAAAQELSFKGSRSGRKDCCCLEAVAVRELLLELVKTAGCTRWSKGLLMACCWSDGTSGGKRYGCSCAMLVWMWCTSARNAVTCPTRSTLTDPPNLAPSHCPQCETTVWIALL